MTPITDGFSRWHGVGNIWDTGRTQAGGGLMKLSYMLLAFAVPVLTAQAPQITRIEFSPVPVEQGGGLLIGILGTGPCSYQIDFGDGTTEHRNVDLPDRMRHAYAADQEYTVVATPEAPCEGVARARIDVRAITRGIWGISVEPGPSTDAAEVIVTIKGRGACVVHLAFGDTKNEKLEGTLPLKVNHTYPSAGTYELHATTDEPCRGESRVKADVRRQPG
jgi:hypothetical protein